MSPDEIEEIDQKKPSELTWYEIMGLQQRDRRRVKLESFRGQEKNRADGTYDDYTKDKGNWKYCTLCNHAQGADFDYFGYPNHAASCPIATEREVRWHLYHVLEENKRLKEKNSKCLEERTFWEGKYHIVKAENNSLRRKLKKEENNGG